jgi:hypothetical protein
MSILLNPVFPSLPIPKPIAKKPVAKEKKKEKKKKRERILPVL